MRGRLTIREADENTVLDADDCLAFDLSVLKDRTYKSVPDRLGQVRGQSGQKVMVANRSFI
jgi:hypothetical protein